MPKAVDQVKTKPLLKAQQQQQHKQHTIDHYVHMKNHHQGMFLATPQLLLAWKARPQCRFDLVTDRPGGHSQPSEGTQRVWMSSQQLYAPKHCAIQQIIPLDRFGAFTVLHLPNKNYRRAGHFRKRTFSDGTETFDMGSPNLLTALKLHIEMRQKISIPNNNYNNSNNSNNTPYSGITMIDCVDRKQRWNSPELRHKFDRQDYYHMLDRRINDYNAYVHRGGTLTLQDLTKTQLLDIKPPPPKQNTTNNNNDKNNNDNDTASAN